MPRHLVWLLLWGVALPARAQAIRLDDGPMAQASALQHVELLTAAVQAEAGKASWVELRFRVAPGFHINSHTPHDELLLPTGFELVGEPTGKPAGGGVTVLRQEYPAGVPLRLAVGDGEVLSTYQGEFAVRLQVLAGADARELRGTLRYQACDAHSCFPPRKLPVRVTLAAR